MSNRLSYTIRFSPICDGRPEEIVDLEIDAESVWHRMRRLDPNLMALPQASNPDGAFVGVSVWIVRNREDAYRLGYHHRHQGQWAGLLPLLACSDCGWEGCGGIWTRVFVGPKRVFWAGLGFAGAGYGFSKVYDSTVFVFDRGEYDSAMEDLVSQIQASSPTSD